MKFISIGPGDAKMFDNLVRDKPAFVKFYHPSCGHCVEMAPAWAAMKDELNDKNYDANIIEVHADAIQGIKSASAKNIEGFPMIMMVDIGGNPSSSYDGERSSKKMAEFFKNRMAQAPQQIGGKSSKYKRITNRKKQTKRTKHKRRTKQTKHKRRTRKTKRTRK
jgi:thiol-disulfide isomerase/thioredoxin